MILANFGSWFIHTALGGGLILLLAWLGMRYYRQPARRQLIGECGVAAALVLGILSLAPAWIVLPFGLPLPASGLNSVPSLEETDRSERVAGRVNPNELADRPAAERVPSLEDLYLHGYAGTWEEDPYFESETGRPNEAGSDCTPGRAGGDGDSDVAATGANPMSRGTDSRSAARDSVHGAHAGSSSSITEHALWINALAMVQRFAPVLIAIYLAGVLVLGARWLLGLLLLSRIVRQGWPAPAHARGMLEGLSGSTGKQPRLLVSSRLKIPISFGLMHPTIVLPEGLCESGEEQKLRWVLAHEWTHLQRHDGWTSWLIGLGQAVYYYVPWFWFLRRQVRLCQEYIADAAAVENSAGREDYAQFLLSLSTLPAVPLGAAGVSGSSSDLFRRVTMLVKDRFQLEMRCPRWWGLAASGGLLSLAVVVSGLSLRTEAARADGDGSRLVAFNPVRDQEPPKVILKKDQPSKPDKQADEADEIELNLDIPGLDPEVAKKMREQMKKIQKNMKERMQGQFQFQAQPFGFQGQANPGFGGFGGFGQIAGFGGGRLGIRVQTPSATLVEHLGLAKDTGLVVDSVEPNSAAAKAGIKPHDILLEFDGKPVSSDSGKFVRSIADIKADAVVDAVVLRKGKKETIKNIKLPEAKQVRGFPQGFGQGIGNFGGGGGGVGGFPQIQPLQQPPALPQFGAPPAFQGLAGGQGIMTSVFRSNDRFTCRHQEGSLIITVTGKVEDGKAQVNQIYVNDGGQGHKYDSLDKVADAYRDKVKNLIDMNEKSGIKIEIRTGPGGAGVPKPPAPKKDGNQPPVRPEKE